MRVKSLSLRNIGLFIEAEMEFITDADEKPPVVLITGENGTGKSIILDAIRGMFGPLYGYLERDIRRRKRAGKAKIDEAENQLHPKWQKRFFRTILNIFPNLQIIATTHSPFIISSVPDARLFVCKSKVDHCKVVDETAEYSNKPVEQILMSPLFEGTQPFNEEISQLMVQREQAIKAGDRKERRQLEDELKARNPEYFSYLDVDELLKEVARVGIEV